MQRESDHVAQDKKIEKDDEKQECISQDFQNIATYENLEEACQNIKQEFTSGLVKWSKAFNESEKFDGFFEKRLDELITDAEKKNLYM